MKLRAGIAVAALALASPAALADAVNNIKLVQEKLTILGFYDGRIDGDPSGRTQAAIARFQLSRNLPASGSADRRTMDELGVQPEGEQAASTGGSLPPAGEAATTSGSAGQNPSSGETR